MEEIELSSPFVVKAFRVCGYLFSAAFAAFGLMVLLREINGPQGLAEAPRGTVGVTVFLALVSLGGVIQSRRLRYVVASPDGIRSDGRFVPWSEVKRLAVFNSRVKIKHEGGVIRSLLLMPRFPGHYSAAPIDFWGQVVAWRREDTDSKCDRSSRAV